MWQSKILICLALVAGSGYAQPIDTAAVVRLGSPQYGDRLYDVIAAPDGGYIAGGHKGYFNNSKAYIAKVNESGDTVWTREYQYASNFSVRALVANHAGNGYVIAAGSYPYAWLIFTDLSGVAQNSRFYEEPNYGLTLSDLARCSDGGYFLLTNRNNVSAWLIKTNSVGDQIWALPFGLGAFAALATPDSGVVIVGYTANGAWIAKINALGTLQWEREHVNTPYVTYTTVLPAPDGGYYIGGYDINSRGCLFKTDSDGDTLWTRRYAPGTFNVEVYGLAATPDGSIVVAGGMYVDATNVYDPYVLKVSESGDSLWTYSTNVFACDVFRGIVAVGDESFRAVGWGSDGWFADLRRTCVEPVPPPSGLVVQILGNDTQVSWQPVPAGSDNTCSYFQRAYILYYSQFSGGPFYFLNYTANTSFLHDNVVPFSPAMYYQVTAYNGPPLLLVRLWNDGLQTLLSETDVERLLHIPQY